MHDQRLAAGVDSHVIPVPRTRFVYCGLNSDIMKIGTFSEKLLNRNMKQLGYSLICLIFAGVWISPASADEVTFAGHIQPFLEQHCFKCHGAEEQEAQIRYDLLQGSRVQDQQLWTMVHERLAAGEMPPAEEPQPKPEDVKRVLAWIEQQAAAHKASGSGSIRRLNRRELSAALQDVTGLPINYRLSLPGDGKVGGFDTGASGLHDAADSISEVMKVTRQAVDGIRVLEESPSLLFSADLREVEDARRELDDWKKLADDTRVKVRGQNIKSEGLLMRPKWMGERGSDLSMRIPMPAQGRGILRIKMVVSTIKHFDGLPDPNFTLSIANIDSEYVRITGTAEEPQEIEFYIQLDDMPLSDEMELEFRSVVEMPYAVKGFENEVKGDDDGKRNPSLFRPEFDKKADVEKQPVPFVMLHALEVETNVRAAWPPQRWEANVSPLEDNPETAKRLLSIWMDRAWRRPVSDAELNHFFALYESLRGQEMSFDEALRASFQSVLMSGPFRYLQSPEAEDETVAQHAIASRLSFMLCGTPPDAELRKLAAAGKLREAKVLDEQVDRLLNDPRSMGFARPFVTQWLEMGQPITIAMASLDDQDFRFARYLKESMQDETILYFAKVLEENRPARELVDSDWTMMNNVLAFHYGYEGISGGEFQKVTLRSDDPRGGGILAHAGIQSMLTWMGENWVIYRGAWALRHIFDDPPPPPPLEVPELEPSAGENRGKSFRELLVQHQEDARCTVCHKKMDPLGFAFQNFDISGRWREEEFERYVTNEIDGKIEWRGAGKSRPVDATGQLPRGEEFSNFAEFKDKLAQHYIDDMMVGLLKNLSIYGASRKPDVEDMKVIRAIADSHQSEGYPLRDLVKAFVRSDIFLGNKNQ